MVSMEKHVVDIRQDLADCKKGVTAVVKRFQDIRVAFARRAQDIIDVDFKWSKSLEQSLTDDSLLDARPRQSPRRPASVGARRPRSRPGSARPTRVGGGYDGV